jgi:hypothetical protein
MRVSKMNFRPAGSGVWSWLRRNRGFLRSKQPLPLSRGNILIARRQPTKSAEKDYRSNRTAALTSEGRPENVILTKPHQE